MAENREVMQTKRDQLIAHDIKKFHTISFGKQIKGNGWKQLSNTWFGTFWVKVVFGMHTHCMHVSHIHATVDFEI